MFSSDQCPKLYSVYNHDVSFVLQKLHSLFTTRACNIGVIFIHWNRYYGITVLLSLLSCEICECSWLCGLDSKTSCIEIELPGNYVNPGFFVLI